MTPSKIIDSYWFTTHAGRSFWIVKVQTTNWIRFYIGNAKGADQKADEKSIHKYGSPLNGQQVARYLTTSEIEAVPEEYKYNKKHHGELLGMFFVGIGTGLAMAVFYLSL